MSIIAAATTQPTSEELLQGLFFFLMLTIPGLLILWRFRVHKAAEVVGPRRIPSREPYWPVIIAGVLAFLAWQGAAVAYAVFVYEKAKRTGAMAVPADQVDLMSLLSPTDFIILAAATPFAGLAAGLAFLYSVRREAIGWIGLTLQHFAHSAGLGLLAAVFAIPATMFVGVLVELAYKSVQFVHPAEHDLLKFMNDAPEEWIKWAAIAAAVLVAPLVEEFIFRGLLQTSLVTWFSRIGRGQSLQPIGLSYSPPIPAADVNASPTPSTEGAAEPAVPPAATVWLPPVPNEMGYATPGGTVTIIVNEAPVPPWCAWLAIVVTSLLFALVHPLWTAPIIFFLSLILGYLYERTGNLWAVMILHATFNGVSTALYLASTAN